MLKRNFPEYIEMEKRLEKAIYENLAWGFYPVKNGKPVM
jgi:hypothetical protein